MKSKIAAILIGSALAACTVKTAPATVQPVASPTEASTHVDDTSDAPTGTEGGIICNGSEDIELVGRHIVADGDGLVVNGACTVKISNSKIDATGWAIVINGTGDVEIVDSEVRGGAGSVALNGAADLNATGTQFVGRVSTQGAADVNDGGGNSWN